MIPKNEEQMETSILLSFPEINLLLQSLGYETVRGICMEQPTLPDWEVLQLLQGMAGKEMLSAWENRFLINETLGDMLRCMGDAKKEYTLDFADGQFFYCYERCGKVLAVSLFQWKKNMLKLTLLDKKEFEKWRQEIIDDIGGYRGSDFG